MASLIDYLETKYRRINDDSVINNNYNITKIINNINTQEHYTYNKYQNITQTYYTQHIHTNDTYTYKTNITNKDITHNTVPNYIHT